MLPEPFAILVPVYKVLLYQQCMFDLCRFSCCVEDVLLNDCCSADISVVFAWQQFGAVHESVFITVIA